MKHTTNESTNEIPYGYCHCGCGQKTTIATYDDRRNGIKQGEPRKYIRGHHVRIHRIDPGPNPSGFCMCGCGGAAPIARKTSKKNGWIQGKPVCYIAGHQPKGPSRTQPKSRFWQKVNKKGPVHTTLNTRCWVWTAAITGFGYGRFWDGQNDITAHRYSYILHHGGIPDGLWVLHRCDNPICVNPAHLFAGTRQDNVDDMVAKNRHRQGHCPAGESNPSSKLTAEQVLEIRAIAEEGAPRKQIAKSYGVSLPLVEKIISRAVWKHI